MKEVWRDIPNYPYYKLSNFGRIISKKRTVKDKNGHLRSYPETELKPRVSSKGDVLVNLSHQGTSKTFMLKTLLARTYLEPPTHPSDVLEFINGDRDDFRVDNLRYITLKEHRQKTKQPPTRQFGEVIMINPDTNRPLKRFKTVKEACDYLGEKSTTNIHYAIQGVYKTAYGYKWRREEEENG